MNLVFLDLKLGNVRVCTPEDMAKRGKQIRKYYTEITKTNEDMADIILYLPETGKKVSVSENWMLKNWNKGLNVKAKGYVVEDDPTGLYIDKAPVEADNTIAEPLKVEPVVEPIVVKVEDVDPVVIPALMPDPNEFNVKNAIEWIKDNRTIQELNSFGETEKSGQNRTSIHKAITKQLKSIS